MFEIQEGLIISVVGVGVVFVALTVVAFVVGIIGRLAQDKPPIPASKAAPLPDVAYTGIDKHVVVLLAAAATAAVKRPVRIRRVRFVSHQRIPTEWAAAGRSYHVEESR